MSPEKCFSRWFVRFVFLFVCLCPWTDTVLVINVRNQGGDVLQETVSANTSEDTVSLEFQRSDGTLVTQLIDFRNTPLQHPDAAATNANTPSKRRRTLDEVQILKALVLGEEERGQSQYQVMCFIFHISKDAFISSDAMSKLRQKNPGTIRTPEEDRGRENYTMDNTVILEKSAVISPHIADMCAEAVSSTFTRYEDVKIWASLQGLPESIFARALQRFPTTPDPLLLSNHISYDSEIVAIESCSNLKKVWSPCQCHLELCIGWFPCGLKYCKGKGESKSSTMTYRCGIKTCKKCHLFAYYVAQKQLCLWDE